MNGLKKYGFTILELLVVLSVIMILASLLLPALRTAKEKSSEIHCLGNIKQIFVAAASYCVDSQISQMGSAYWHPGYWCGRLDADGYVPKRATDTYGNPLKGIFVCNKETRTSTNPLWVYGWRGTHYGLNWFLGRADGVTTNDGIRWGPKERISQPSKTMYFADTTWKFDAYCFYDPDYRDTAIPTYFRHNNKMNFVFIDGHGQSGSYKQVPNEFTLGGNAFNYYFWYKRTTTTATWLDM